MLSTGSIKEMINGVNVKNPVLQILAFKPLVKDDRINTKYRLLLTDGKYYFEGFILLNRQFNEQIRNGTLKKNTIIELNEFHDMRSLTRLKIIIVINQLTKIKDASKGCFSEKLVHCIKNSEEISQKISLTYVSLKDLCSEIRRGREYFSCTIKVKVVDKSEILTWKKNEKEGTYRHLAFQDIDDEEEKIKAISFNEKLNDNIQIDMVYYLTHFKVGRKNLDICQIVLNDKTNIIPVLKATMPSEEISSANQENTYSKDSNTVFQDQHWINLTIVIFVFLIIIIVLVLWSQSRLHLYLPGK